MYIWHTYFGVWTQIREEISTNLAYSYAHFAQSLVYCLNLSLDTTRYSSLGVQLYCTSLILTDQSIQPAAN